MLAIHLLLVAPEKGNRRADGAIETYGEDHAYVVDTTTGKRTLFAPLEGMFTREPRRVPGTNTLGVHIVSRPADFVPSRSGRWLLARGAGKLLRWRVLPTPLTTKGASGTGALARTWDLPEGYASRPIPLLEGERWASVVRAPVLQVLLFDAERANGGGSLPIVPGPGAEKTLRVGSFDADLGRLADGRLLIKMGTPDGTRDLALSLKADRAIATPFARLAKDDVDIDDLALSPDGKRLAYRSQRLTLCVSDPDGGHAIDLAPGVESHSFVWSPDSRRILFGKSLTVWCVAVPFLKP